MRNYAQEFEAACKVHGVRAGVEYLEAIQKDLADLQSDVTRMLKTARDVAVTHGIAAYVLEEPKELAPTKDQFIKLYGAEEFRRVMRISSPRRIFTWTA
jgi:hypothetical protein